MGLAEDATCGPEGLAACLCLMTPVKAGGASEDHVPAARTTQHNISTMNGRKDEAEETEDKV